MTEYADEYMRRLLLASQCAPFLLQGGRVTNVMVMHDHGIDPAFPRCGSLSGRHCDCDPDIILDHDGTKYAVDRDGSVRPLP